MDIMLTVHFKATNTPKIPNPARRATRNSVRRAMLLAMIVFAVVASGCGTTRWTNSPRTGTELLLISDAIDRSVDRMDFQTLRGQSVFLDTQYLKGTLDEGYIVSSIRQKLLASGCSLTENRNEAKFIVEARSGGVGTDQTDLTFGIPSVNIPPVLGSVGGVPPSIPEVPLIKKTAQKGVVKLAVFAYERETGRAVWQSGATPVDSTAKATYVFGAGPFQQGTIYERPKFAGSNLPIPQTLSPVGLSHPDEFDEPGELEEDSLSVTSHAIFLKEDALNQPVQLADHQEPAGEEPPQAKSRSTLHRAER
jgi:hypothetical protein